MSANRKTTQYPMIGDEIVGGIFDGYTLAAEKANRSIVLTRNKDERIVITGTSWANFPHFDFAPPIPPMKVGDRVRAAKPGDYSSTTSAGTIRFIVPNMDYGVVVQWDSQERLNVWKAENLEHLNDC